MDLQKLSADRETDPALAELDRLSLKEVAEKLTEAHRYLADPKRAGHLAYLYRKQIERVRALTQEIEDVKRKLPPSRR